MTGEGSRLAALVAIMPPPAAPRDPTGDWGAVEEEIGARLPADYRGFVDAYGSGSIDDFVNVFNPFSDNPYLRLADAVRENLGIYREIRSYEHIPFPIHPEPGGLLPWASTSNGDVLFWVTDPPGDPDQWSIAVGEVRGPGWFNHPGPLAGFLHDWLARAIEIPFLSDPPRPVFSTARPWAETQAIIDAQSAMWRAWGGHPSSPGPPGPASPDWPPATTDAWIQALRSGTADGRDAAARHLGAADDAVLLRLVELLDEDNPTIWVSRAILGHGTAAVRPLLDLLERRGGRLNLYLAEALGGTGADEVVEPLLNALAADDDVTRTLAASGLARLRRPETAAALVVSLGDPDLAVREASARALAEVGRPDDAPHLAPLLADRAWWVRAAAARAVGRLGGDPVVADLAALLDDANEKVRVAAIEGLAATGSPAAAMLLIGRLPTLDPRLPVREELGAAVRGLGMLRDERARAELQAVIEADFRDWRPAAGEPTFEELARAALAAIDGQA